MLQLDLSAKTTGKMRVNEFAALACCCVELLWDEKHAAGKSARQLKSVGSNRRAGNEEARHGRGLVL